MFIIFLLSLPLIGFSLGTIANKDILISYVVTSMFIFYFFLHKNNAKIFLPKEIRYLGYFLVYIFIAMLYRSSANIITVKNISGLTTIAIYFLFYLLLTNVFILLDKNRINKLINWFILICTISSLITSLQAVLPANSVIFNLFRNSWSSFTNWDPTWSSVHDSWGSLNRVTGFAPEPGMWAAFLAVPLSLLLPRLYHKFRIKDFFYFLSILLGFLLTYGRTGWMGFALAVIAFPGLLLSGRKKKLYLLFVVVVVCLTLYSSIFSKMNLEQGVDWSAYERGAGMIIASRMFTANPLFGIGLGDYRTRAADYQFIGLSMGGGGGVFPYNFYLSLAAETGIIGIVLWLLFLKCLWDKSSCKIAQLQENTDLKILFMGVGLAFLTILFSWINLATFNLMYVFFVFALISALSQATNEPKIVPIEMPGGKID